MIDKALMFSPSSLSDIIPPEHLAKPIALPLHALHFLLSAPLFKPTEDEATSIISSGRTGSGAGSRWDRWEEEHRDRSVGLLGSRTVSNAPPATEARTFGISKDMADHA